MWTYLTSITCLSCWSRIRKMIIALNIYSQNAVCSTRAFIYCPNCIGGGMLTIESCDVKKKLRKRCFYYRYLAVCQPFFYRQISFDYTLNCRWEQSAGSGQVCTGSDTPEKNRTLTLQKYPDLQLWVTESDFRLAKVVR